MRVRTWAVFSFLGAFLAMSEVTHGAESAAARPSAEELIDKFVRSVRGNGVYPNPRELMGRSDILPLLTKRIPKYEPDLRKDIISNALEIGADPRERRDRWLFCPELAKFLVHLVVTDPDEDVRNRAAKALVYRFPDSYLRSHTSKLIVASKKRLTDWDIYLLGKSGAVEARRLLLEDKYFREVSLQKYELALAKLGDTKLVDKFIASYREEKDPRRKVQAAWDLGYIGSSACVLALARDMRTSQVIPLPAQGERSLRVDIAKALGMIFPEEPCFWVSRVEPPEDDTWYAEIEKWLERRFRITWRHRRPPFLFEIPGHHARP